MTTQVQPEEKTDTMFFELVKDRRSVRKYDSNTSISEAEIRELLTIATKAPSSANMQPWRFLVVTDQALKEKLVPIAFNQQQVAEASAVVIVMADMEMYKLAEDIYGSAVAAGYMTEEVKTNMINNYTNMYASLPTERLKEIVVFDTGLVAMQLMLAARAKGYDTVPMGGYNRDQVKELFGISERYVPTLMLPIGKAAAQGHPTTRLDVDQVTFFNSL